MPKILRMIADLFYWFFYRETYLSGVKAFTTPHYLTAYFRSEPRWFLAQLDLTARKFEYHTCFGLSKMIWSGKDGKGVPPPFCYYLTALGIEHDMVLKGTKLPGWREDGFSPLRMVQDMGHKEVVLRDSNGSPYITESVLPGVDDIPRSELDE